MDKTFKEVAEDYDKIIYTRVGIRAGVKKKAKKKALDLNMTFQDFVESALKMKINTK